MKGCRKKRNISCCHSANYTGLDIGRYEKDGENDKFYPGDDEETYAHYGLIVNAMDAIAETV